jgi:hypothetical protein
MNPFDRLAEEACATLRDYLAAEGLALEASAALPSFERSIRATIAAVESTVPNDLPLDFALAYLTGRIAREQALVIERARSQVSAARDAAERHWQAAIERERRRLARASTQATTALADSTDAPRQARLS